MRRTISDDEAVSIAVAASGLAGHDVLPDARALLDRIGHGELTHDDAVAEVIAEFGDPRSELSSVTAPCGDALF